jgi:hypothetical protein
VNAGHFSEGTAPLSRDRKASLVQVGLPKPWWMLVSTSIVVTLRRVIVIVVVVIVVEWERANAKVLKFVC